MWEKQRIMIQYFISGKKQLCDHVNKNQSSKRQDRFIRLMYILDKIFYSYKFIGSLFSHQINFFDF